MSYFFSKFAKYCVRKEEKYGNTLCCAYSGGES